MTIQDIKNTIKNNIGSNVRVKFNGGRNKCEEYDGVISDAFPFIFTIKKTGVLNEIKSFSYCDVLTKNVKVTFEE